MTSLSVNVNKIATLRNAREKNTPDVVSMGEKILRFGAHGLTVHPRPDGRHIRTADVWALQDLVKTWNEKAAKRAEFNIEGFPSEDFLTLVAKVNPQQCTLVPDPPEALTSNAGWNLVEREQELGAALGRLRTFGIRSSIFIDPAQLNPEQIAALRRLHPDRVELYTEAYADHFSSPKQSETTAIYRAAAEAARTLEIGVNAGHDLNQRNLKSLVTAIPWMDEVSIGHALVCEALEDGMEKTVTAYLAILRS